MLCRYLLGTALWASLIGADAQVTLLDPTFGNNGIVFQGLSGVGGDMAEDVAVLPDGRIAVAATRGGPDAAMAALRLLENGLFDNSFSGNGVAIAQMGVSAEGRALAVQPDGYLVIAGNAEFPGSFDDLAFARFTADGVLDTSFSGDGRLTLPRPGASDAVLALAVQPDGRILAAGKFDGIVADMMALRLTAAGILDASFADNGVFNTDLQTGELAEDMVLRPNGRVLLAGAWRLDLPDADMAMLQLDDAGVPDPTFGTDGLFRPSEAGSVSAVVSALELEDGRVLILGRRYPPGGSVQETFTGRVTVDGAWDTSYGIGGRSFLSLGAGLTGAARDMVRLADGKALVTVDVMDGNGNQSIMALRVLPDGGLDPAFGTGGRVVMPCPGTGCNVKALALDPQQRIIAVGSYGTIDGPEIMIMRWLAEASGVGEQESVASAELSVYPMPCSDAIHVNLTCELPADARFQLVDALGRSIAEFPAAGRGPWRLTLPGSIAEGSYALRLSSATRVVSQRVIVQR